MISGIVVGCRPENLEGVIASVSRLEWADVHHSEASGRIIATIEARDADESVERLMQVKGMPDVIMAELVSYYMDDEDSGSYGGGNDGPDPT